MSFERIPGVTSKRRSDLSREVAEVLPIGMFEYVIDDDTLARKRSRAAGPHADADFQTVDFRVVEIGQVGGRRMTHAIGVSIEQ